MNADAVRAGIVLPDRIEQIRQSVENRMYRSHKSRTFMEKELLAEIDRLRALERCVIAWSKDICPETSMSELCGIGPQPTLGAGYARRMLRLEMP